MVRALIMGAGGVGGYFGAALQASGADVVFCARGVNLKALRSSGLTVRGAREIALPSVHATDDPAGAGDRDLVLLCVKSYDLEEAAATVRPCGGIALTLQNGVDAAARASAILGDGVLAGATNIVADLVEPGLIELTSPYQRIRFGEPDGGLSERVERVRRWLDVEGVQAEPMPDVRVALWEKMAVICGFGGLTTLYRSTLGPILHDPHGRETFRRILRECEAVARASGVPLASDFAEARERWAEGIGYESTSSMYRDLIRGKRLEIDQLNGAIVRLGRELGVPVPVNEAVYAGVRLAGP